MLINVGSESKTVVLRLLKFQLRANLRQLNNYLEELQDVTATQEKLNVVKANNQKLQRMVNQSVAQTKQVQAQHDKLNKKYDETKDLRDPEIEQVSF